MFKKLIRLHTRLFKNATHAILTGLLPPSCILCGLPSQTSTNICVPCSAYLPILPQCCPQCAQFLPSNKIQTKCGQCLSNPPPFDATYARFPYEAPIIQIIIKLKFQHQLSYAQALGEMFMDALPSWYAHQPLPDLIIPIPLHPQRLCERGFNQALEIAKPIAKTLGLAIDYQNVQRIKHTAAQSGLSADERKRNIAHAFAVKRNYKGLTIAVIDDVITTGHTIRECCKVLKQNGAARIDVWCCARRIQK